MSKPAKVVAQYRRFRVFRALDGSYLIQVKRLSGTTPDLWVGIELYDYFSNARARAKEMDAIMDGWSKFEQDGERPEVIERRRGERLCTAWEAFSLQTFATNNQKGFGMPKGADVHWDGNQIALMHGELSEAHEGIRKDLMDDKLPHRKAVEVELADAVIRIMNYARERGLDVAGAMVEKAAFNKTRPHMHGAGKKF